MKRSSWITKLVYAVALLLLPTCTMAAERAGQTPPAPTAANQSPVSVANSLYPNGFQWQPVALPYSTTGTAGDYTLTFPGPLVASPTGTSENAFKAVMPSGATGYGFALYSSTGALVNALPFNNVSLGPGANSASVFGLAAGLNAYAAARDVAVGWNASCSGNSVAVGWNAGCTGTNGFAFGYNCKVTHNYSYILGSNVSSTANNQFVVNNVTDSYLGGVSNTVSQPTTIHGVGGSGTNIAGNALTIAGGQSTGTGAEGVVNIATSGSGSTGTALNSLTSRVTVSQSGLNVLAGGVYQAAGVNGISQTVNGTTYSGGIATASAGPNITAGYTPGILFAQTADETVNASASGKQTFAFAGTPNNIIPANTLTLPGQTVKFQVYGIYTNPAGGPTFTTELDFNGVAQINGPAAGGLTGSTNAYLDETLQLTVRSVSGTNTTAEFSGVAHYMTSAGIIQMPFSAGQSTFTNNVSQTVTLANNYSSTATGVSETIQQFISSVNAN